MKRVDDSSIDLLNNNILMSIAHDLKLPLATIRSIAIDSEMKPGQVEEEYRLITSQADAAINIVSDLLNVYKISSSQASLPLGPVSLNSEMRSVSATVKQADILNGRRLKVHYLPKKNIGLAIAEQSLVRSVLLNLVNNSLKYSDPRAKVVATISTKEESISCEVADSGPSLKQLDIDSLKGVLAASPSKRSAGSSGLGLYLVGAMVELMNGAVRADSDKSGNYITVSFPKVMQQSLFGKI